MEKSMFKVIQLAELEFEPQGTGCGFYLFGVVLSVFCVLTQLISQKPHEGGIILALAVQMGMLSLTEIVSFPRLQRRQHSLIKEQESLQLD